LTLPRAEGESATGAALEPACSSGPWGSIHGPSRRRAIWHSSSRAG